MRNKYYIDFSEVYFLFIFELIRDFHLSSLHPSLKFDVVDHRHYFDHSGPK